MPSLSLFRINTSKNFRHFCISLINGRLKSSIINTSVNFDFKLSRINTSTKTGGRGGQLQLVATGDEPSPLRRASPERSEGSLCGHHSPHAAREAGRGLSGLTTASRRIESR